MGLPRTEYPSWAFPYTMPDGDGPVEADFPRVKEDKNHVVIPCLYHLSKFPKLINIEWGVSVSETKFTSDSVKATIIHKLPKEIRAWFCILIKGGDTPKIAPLSFRSGGYLKAKT